jgi:hypothetical protein
MSSNPSMKHSHSDAVLDDDSQAPSKRQDNKSDEFSPVRNSVEELCVLALTISGIRRGIGRGQDQYTVKVKIQEPCSRAPLPPPLPPSPPPPVGG